MNGARNSLVFLVIVSLSVVGSGLLFPSHYELVTPTAGEKYVTQSFYTNNSCSDLKLTTLTVPTGCIDMGDTNTSYVYVECGSTDVTYLNYCDSTCANCESNNSFPLNQCINDDGYEFSLSCANSVPTFASNYLVRTTYSDSPCKGPSTVVVGELLGCYLENPTEPNSMYYSYSCNSTSGLAIIMENCSNNQCNDCTDKFGIKLNTCDSTYKWQYSCGSPST